VRAIKPEVRGGIDFDQSPSGMKIILIRKRRAVVDDPASNDLDSGHRQHY